MKYSLKLGKASFYRYPVDQTFCLNLSIWHGFRDTSIFVFCDFCEKFENSKWASFLAGQNFFENRVSYSEVPCMSNFFFEIALSSMVFEIQGFLCFAFLKKIQKFKMPFLASEIFVETWKG